MVDVPTNFVFAYLRDIYHFHDEDIAGLDPKIWTERLQRVHQGFSAEHEFAAIASWLGKCSLLTSLDDLLHSSGTYRAPDFLVVVNHEGREIPFLVEVKTNETDVLEWTGNYMASLRSFADLMKLPLLVAWKRHGLWVLTDSNLFIRKVTAHHLTFDDAVKNSLMSMLFGNVWIKFAPEFRLELKMRIQGVVDLTANLLPEGTYQFKIEEAGLWGSKGRLNENDAKDLWWFLVTAASDSRFDRVLDVATQQFVANSDSMFNLSDVLLAQLFWNKGENESFAWLAAIRKGLPKRGGDLHAILSRALEIGAVYYVFRQSPQVLPDFLK